VGTAPASLLRPTDRLRRRRIVSRAVEIVAWLTAAVAVGLLGLLVFSVARRGWSALNFDLLTKAQNPYAPPDGVQGLANAFVGSLVMVAIATAMALPFGILIALYLNEFAPRWVRGSVGLVLDVLAGIPAIVIGIFVFGLIVVGHGQSGLAASFALAILMLPIVFRTTMEVLAIVPQSLREASLGLGVPRWRTTLSIVLPQTIGGVLTGAVLAVARVAGETAPLLFTSAIVGAGISANPQHALMGVPLAIFELSESPDPADQARAWAAAFVLLMFILLTSLAARWFATRNRRRLGRAG
jgi:phosphate transport system permease protein